MRSEKQFLLDEIKDKIQSSNAMIVTNYSSFTSDLAWDFRSRLDKVNSSFEVVKKRVFIKAATKCGIEIDLDHLKDHVGVVFVENEAIDPAKLIYKFNAENGAELSVLFGYLGETKYSSEDVKALSELPTMDEMRSQFISVLQAPMSESLSVMQALLTSVMYCLQNKSEQSS